MLNKIFITGRPGVGKTTLIKGLAEELSIPKNGFYTQEIRNAQGRRTGFKIKNFRGQEGILAAVHIESPYQIGKYGVQLNDLDRIGVAAIERGLQEKNHLIIVDEIGRMELFSSQFKSTIQRALDAENLMVATIKEGKNPFVQNLKVREAGRLFTLTPGNRDNVYQELLRIIKANYHSSNHFTTKHNRY